MNPNTKKLFSLFLITFFMLSCVALSIPSAKAQTGTLNGFNAIATSNLASWNNSLSGEQIRVNQTGTVNTMYAYITSPAGNIQFAFYTNNGDGPETLIWSSASQAVVNGWNSVSCSLGVTSGTTYWMIINLDSATPHLYYQAIIGMNVITSNTLFTFGVWPTPLLSDLSFGDFVFNDTFSMYIAITPGAGPTATPTPAPGATPTPVPTSGTNPTPTPAVTVVPTPSNVVNDLGGAMPEWSLLYVILLTAILIATLIAALTWSYMIGFIAGICGLIVSTWFAWSGSIIISQYTNPQTLVTYTTLAPSFYFVLLPFVLCLFNIVIPIVKRK